MLTLPAPVLAELQARRDVVTRALIWIEARTRDTGDPAPVGLWNGRDTREFDTGSGARAFHGPAFGPLPAIEGGVGLQVRTLRHRIAHLSPEALSILRTYDASRAPVEIHFAYFAAETRAHLGLLRVWRGEIDELPETTGAAGGEGGVDVSIVSAARELTRILPLYRSDGDQQARASGDLGREFAGSTRTIYWGQAAVGVASSATPAIKLDDPGRGNYQ